MTDCSKAGNRQTFPWNHFTLRRGLVILFGLLCHLIISQMLIPGRQLQVMTELILLEIIDVYIYTHTFNSGVKP